MEINAQAQMIIADFAKQSKVGKAKVETFAQALFATLPKPAKTGRKLSENAILLREKLKTAFADHGFSATAKDLALIYDASPVEITNALIWLEEQGGVSRIDTLKIEGKRGKPATIWGNKKQVIEGKEEA